jgi:hypothetical protein
VESKEPGDSRRPALHFHKTPVSDPILRSDASKKQQKKATARNSGSGI